MATTYEYDKPGSTSPDLDGIQSDIDGSAMTNKDELCICWNESDGKLHMVFAVALSGGDETILDGIAAGY